MTRLHRNQIIYPELWDAIAGAVRDACNSHADIQIPDRRVASVTKRCVGQVLALAARVGEPTEKSPSAPWTDGS